MKRRLIRSAVALVSTTAFSMNAATIFSNFGPGDSFDAGGESAFTVAGSNYRLTRIELGLGLAVGPNLLDVWLMSDAGNEPATIIESFNLAGAMEPLAAHAILSVDSVVQPNLQRGVQLR